MTITRMGIITMTITTLATVTATITTTTTTRPPRYDSCAPWGSREAFSRVRRRLWCC